MAFASHSTQPRTHAPTHTCTHTCTQTQIHMHAHTRTHKHTLRYVWQSTADGHFSIAEDNGEDIGRGTVINIHLKPEAQEYSEVGRATFTSCFGGWIEGN